MHRYAFLAWVPRGLEVTEQLAALLVQKEGESRGIPPAADPDIEVRPVEVHEDSAGFVHPDVDGRDFYVLEYDADLGAIGERALCPPT
ncbi:hypothetical protein ACF07S_10415 [Streptomyces sp. NPDC016640]|uniref:hypothetical protein n=1 Tax=Streptomyces sp. NPDC016640 TaxID=3364969 RepID=UPI0036FE8117